MNAGALGIGHLLQVPRISGGFRHGCLYEYVYRRGMEMKKILIVDDDADLLHMLSQHLSQADYQVEQADSGMVALDKIRRNRPDVVLLDINLPDQNGLTILERILRANPEALVIMMTGEGDISTAVQAMKLGARDFLSKPFDNNQLKYTIHSLLQNEADVSAKFDLRPIVGESPEIMEVWAKVVRYALPEVSILLSGQSGTGKELFARAIHAQSKRRDRVFVALDCATLPETLVESELFGHEKGAFTGATEQKIGKFEQASGGTIFLDEIGNLPLNFQAKLLRVIQERYIDRLGGQKPIPVDVRIVSASNLDLEQAVLKGTFREDLYYRLAEMVIHIPPLRARRGDIKLLACHYINEFNHRFDRSVTGISDDAWDVLLRYRWPGNVRELENVIRASLLAADNIIDLEHLPEYLRRTNADAGENNSAAAILRHSLLDHIQSAVASGSLDLKAAVAQNAEEFEKTVLSEILEHCRFNQHELCNLLKLDPKTLRAKLHKYGLKARLSRAPGSRIPDMKIPS
jgi:DNA-binding NtrC family response regulator